MNQIKKEHILNAIAEIDKEGIRPGYTSSFYDLIYNGKKYPPKFVIILANKYATGEELDGKKIRSGPGKPAYNLLGKCGFKIISKKKQLENNNMFEWTSLYKEIANWVLPYRNKQKELCDILREIGITGNLNDEDNNGKKPLEVIDPFTFFAFFQKYTKITKRTEFLRRLKEKAGFQSSVPKEFNGLPSAMAMSLWYFYFEKDRKGNEFDLLWDLADQTVTGNLKEDTFKNVLNLPGIKLAKLTQGLFWLNPEMYYPIDAHKPYLEKNGIDCNVNDLPAYLKFLEDVKNKFNKPFYEISHNAYLSSNDKIKHLIEKYKSHIKKARLEDEIYKWEIIEANKGKPDLDAADFAVELNKIKLGNLIYPMSSKVINDLAKYNSEKLRDLFKDLYDESETLEKRIQSFEKGIKTLYREIEETKQHHQDERTISNYLTIKYPNKYTIYKDSYYQKFCKLLGVKPEKTGKKYVHYLELIDKLIENYIKTDNDLIKLVKSIITKYYDGTNHLILAQDILYQMLDKETDEIDFLFEDVLSNFDKNDLETYFSFLSEIIQKFNLEKGDDRIVFSIKYNNLNFTIGQRYCWNLFSDEKRGKFGAISDEKLSNDSESFTGGSKHLYYNFYDEFNFSTKEKNLFFSSIKYQLERTSRSSYYKHNNTDFENYVFDNKQKKSLMSRPLNQILYGPPGTGKTYNTINRAIEIIDPKFDLKQDRVILKMEFDRLVETKQIVFTTFHQSMSYEDFVEGIKPQEPEKEGDPVIYKIEDGLFKQLSIEASFSIAEENEFLESGNILDFSLAYDNLVEQIEDDFSKSKIIELKTKNGGIVFVDSISPQGNILVKHENSTRLYTVSKQRLSKLQKSIKNLDEINNINNQFRDIIGGSNSSAYWAVLNKIRKEIEVDKQISIKRNYSREEKKEVVKALKKSDYKNKKGKPFVIIIDEINRGNVSQIFGELITLIEDDKRLGNEEALEAKLPYSKDSFGVPPNLFIIGTMNTADRSVEALDTALRRRFSFVETPSKPYLIRTKNKTNNGIVEGIDLSNLLIVINKRIEKLIDKDHMIGHSYFLNIHNLIDLKNVFYNNIIPLLQEYFFGDYGKIGLVIGKDFFDDKSKNEEDIFAEFDYDSGALSEKTIYRLKNTKLMIDTQFITAINTLLGN